MQVRIDLDRCEGHGRCYVLAPSVFAADAEGNGEVVRDGARLAGADRSRRAGREELS